MKWYLAFILLLFSGIFYAQEVRIQQWELDRAHVDRYNSVAANHAKRDSVEFYYTKSQLIAEEIGYWEGEVTACKGLIAFHQADKEIYDKLRYSLLLVNIYEKHGSNDQKVQAYNQLGKLYFNERLYAKSVEQYKKAISLEGDQKKASFETQMGLIKAQKSARDLDDAIVSARILEYKNGLTNAQKVDLLKEKATIYHDLKAFPQELESYEAILPLVKNGVQAYLEPTIWNNIGYTNKYLNNYSAAKGAFLQAARSGNKNDNELLGASFHNLGLILYNERDLDSALLCFEKARVHYANINDFEQSTSCLNMQAMTYYQQNDAFNAQKKVNLAIQSAKSHNLANVLSRSYEIKSLIHQDLYEFELALESYKQFLSIRDSLLTEDRVAENKRLFDQYKIEQIEKQLRLIWAKNELDVLNLAREKAEKEAERERFNTKQKEDQLRISALQNKELRAREELQRLMLREERLNLENKNKQLVLSERENQLKELALEKERLVVNANEKEIRFLAQKSELEQQKRMNEKAEFNYQLRLVFGALLFIFLILLGILYAYRKLQQRKKHIEQQNVIIAQSKEVIEREKEKSEGLLLNILPIAIAEELKHNGTSKPKLYDEVSVGFTDFSGFTMISEKLTPEMLVEKLDEIFYAFDLIIERHGLQRIKTIGDAYMFAAGVPEPLEDHAVRIVEAAIEMRNYIEQYNRELHRDDPKWNIRIGVNTGPIVAGVIGIKKFAYDIWGDAVNLAARMESSGEVAKVNVSGSTYELIKGHFATEHRGKIAAKNKGEVDMYFVEHL